MVGQSLRHGAHCNSAASTFNLEAGWAFSFTHLFELRVSFLHLSMALSLFSSKIFLKTKDILGLVLSGLVKTSSSTSVAEFTSPLNREVGENMGV